MSDLRAFHATPAIKQQYLDRVKAHREAGNLVRGTSWWKGRGGAIGCTIESADRERYETELGIPVALAHLKGRLFEGLPVEDRQAWPERFLKAIDPGADLSQVADRWALWLLSDEASPIAPWHNEPHITQTAALYERRLNDDEPSAEQWDAVNQAAGKAINAIPPAEVVNDVPAPEAIAIAVAKRAITKEFNEAATAAAHAPTQAAEMDSYAASTAAWKGAWRGMADALTQSLEDAPLAEALPAQRADKAPQASPSPELQM